MPLLLLQLLNLGLDILNCQLMMMVMLIVVAAMWWCLWVLDFANLFTNTSVNVLCNSIAYSHSFNFHKIDSLFGKLFYTLKSSLSFANGYVCDHLTSYWFLICLFCFSLLMECLKASTHPLYLVTGVILAIPKMPSCHHLECKDMEGEWVSFS